jgi:hypothetical protein
LSGQTSLCPRGSWPCISPNQCWWIFWHYHSERELWDVTGKWKKLAGPQDICKGFTEIGNINCTIEPIHSRTARYTIHRPFWICINAKRDPKKLESIRFQHKYDLWHRLFNKGLQAWCNIYASKQKSWTIRMENLQKVMQYWQRKKSWWGIQAKE